MPIMRFMDIPLRSILAGFRWAGAAALLCAGSGAVDAAAASLSGDLLALRSTGTAQGKSWGLDHSGYVGTYVHVPSAGRVVISVDASGTTPGDAHPGMTIAVADRAQAFDVGRKRSTYRLEADLPAGTYLLHVDFRNGQPDASRVLTIHHVQVEGADFSNFHTDSNALAAADTYIRHFRRGAARVQIPGIAPGTNVQVALVRHAFRFGANVPYIQNRFLPSVVPPGSDAERFQRFLLANFSTVVLSNGGKWAYQEAQRDQLDLAYIDRFIEFAADHGLYARMHNLLWDTDQQPAWVIAEGDSPGLLTRTLAGDSTAKRELIEQIDERIDYYVRQRAHGYDELDVVNESLHRPRYWQAFGDAGFAELFRKVHTAIVAGGNRSGLFLNEYNVLQASRHPLVKDAEPDPYANWYRHHAEAILRSGGPVTGLGVQYAADGRAVTELGADVHSPARITAVLQNLAGTGLRLTLTEFSVNSAGISAERAAQILDDTLRIVFGTPQADSFLIWAIWAKAAQTPAPLSVLLDENDQLTPAGVRYSALMKDWQTELSSILSADGTIAFDGFFGDYSISVGDKVGCLRLRKGTATYRLELNPAPAKAAGEPVRGCRLMRSSRSRTPSILPPYDTEQRSFAVLTVPDRHRPRQE